MESLTCQCQIVNTIVHIGYGDFGVKNRILSIQWAIDVAPRSFGHDAGLPGMVGLPLTPLVEVSWLRT